jgi:hypothetical protein
MRYYTLLWLSHTTAAAGTSITGAAEQLAYANGSSAVRAAVPLLKAAHVGVAVAPVGMQLAEKPFHSAGRDRFEAVSGVPSAD